MITRTHFDRCIQCGDQVHHQQFLFSTHLHGISLCSPCEKKRVKTKSPTTREQELFHALRKAGIPAILQHDDGHKTVDLAIHELRLHIEVDGDEHMQPRQALTDLKRSLYSLQNDVYTLRLPNRLVKNRIAETVKSIRHLYDMKQSKCNLANEVKQGLLF